MRTSGVLLPITSLPSRYGIGSFSKEAFEFVDQLKKAVRRIGRFFRLGLPDMETPLISHSPLMRVILITLTWRH